MRKFILVIFAVTSVIAYITAKTVEFDAERNKRIDLLDAQIDSLRGEFEVNSFTALKQRLNDLNAEYAQANEDYQTAYNNGDISTAGNYWIQLNELEEEIKDVNRRIASLSPETLSPELDSLVFMRDTLLLNTYLNSIIFNPCPAVPRVLTDAMAQLERIEHPDVRWVVDDYRPLLIKYPEYTDELLSVISDDETFEKSWRRGVPLTATMQDRFLNALHSTEYWRKCYVTTLDGNSENDASIPYLDGIVKEMLRFYDGMCNSINKSNVNQYQSRRDNLIALLTRTEAKKSEGIYGNGAINQPNGIGSINQGLGIDNDRQVDRQTILNYDRKKTGQQNPDRENDDETDEPTKNGDTPISPNNDTPTPPSNDEPDGLEDPDASNAITGNDEPDALNDPAALEQPNADPNSNPNATDDPETLAPVKKDDPNVTDDPNKTVEPTKKNNGIPARKPKVKNQPNNQ